MFNSNCLQSTVYSLPLLRKSVVSSRKAVNQSGQSLLEVIIAMTVGILVVTALVFATIFSLRNAQFAKNSAQATKLAQEGIEKIRAGRDRDSAISISGTDVTSWNGRSSDACVGAPNLKSDSIWCYHISGNCDRPDLVPPGECYLKINNPVTGELTEISGFASNSFPDLLAESVPQTIFKRVIILSDDLNHDTIFTNDDYQNQKEVTVIVTWTDFAGDHESKLTTILRKL